MTPLPSTGADHSRRFRSDRTSKDLGIREERELPLTPGDYKVTPGERWTVTCSTGKTIYSGIGPVEVMRSPARRAGHGLPMAGVCRPQIVASRFQNTGANVPIQNAVNLHLQMN